MTEKLKGPREADGGRSILFIEGEAARTWLSYDRDTETAYNGAAGVAVHLSRGRLDDFLATARELGFRTGMA